MTKKERAIKDRMWLKIRRFATTKSLQDKLARSGITEKEQEWCCYIQSKVLSCMRDSSLASIHHDYFRDKIGRGYVRWLNQLKKWGELEIDHSFVMPNGFRKGATKRYWVPDAALDSGIVIRDFKVKRIKPTKDKSKFPKSKPWVQFIFDNLKMLSVSKELIAVDDPVTQAMCHNDAKKIFHGELNLKTGNKVNRLTHTVLTMPKAGRANLVWRDTNTPLTCEHDIKSCHPVLLLTLVKDEAEQAEYKKWLDRDIYDAVRVTKNLKMCRQQVKDSWCSFVNWEQKSHEGCKNNAVYQFYKEHFPKLTDAILNYPKLAIHLQNLEASIMVDKVAQFCLKNGYWYVPMHDGFLCKNDHFHQISLFVTECFQSLVGYHVNITTKYFSYINNNISINIYNILPPPFLHHMQGYKPPVDQAWQQQVEAWKKANPETGLEAAYDELSKRKRQVKVILDLKRRDRANRQSLVSVVSRNPALMAELNTIFDQH